MKRLGQFLRSLANRVDPPAPSYADFIEDLRREANQRHGATSISEMVRECEAIKREMEVESPESRRIKWDLEALDRAHRPVFARKLRSVPR